MNYDERFDALRQNMDGKKIDYIIILPGDNFRYMTGLKYDPLERLSFMMIGSGHSEVYFFVPKVEIARIETLSRLNIDFDVFMWNDEEGPEKELDTLKKVFGNRHVKIGVEFNRFTLAKKNRLKKLIQNAVLEDTTEVFYELRLKKDKDEIRQFEIASEISDKALKNVIDAVKTDITEREISNRIKIELLKLGSESLPLEFKPIVAIGLNSAKPHTQSGEEMLKKGQTLLIDTGACWKGYAIDITRTFLIEPVDSEMKKIYQAVYEANKKAIESVRPEIEADQIDRMARSVIEDAGYGEFFTHRTGHGIGLEEHEPPWIVSGNTSRLEPGMTFTIEPGIYIPELGGIRIEDNVLVTEEGYKVLTKYPKNLESVLLEL
ncbi:MAG: aminopeptidase P family protein [Deltaproteobacteria bacterium]|nr:aminopeptidase P family protein [Deltaproteobacteria bacterium]MBW1960566.1 aminopeptidase P family protein [Deltaproteobacteria bacterium]MBW1994672.1 aminopeptidase P family protein [Deltaproteobacteria bacterium]MBW2151256.1 aminopeptidase P family protein [Deltaproteobacteria bacterium]